MEKASSLFDHTDQAAVSHLSNVSNVPEREQEYYQQNPNILRDIETLIGNMEQTQAKQNENMLRSIENLLGNMLAKESRPQSRASNISGGYDRINVKSPIPAKNGLYAQQEQHSIENSIKHFVSQHIQDVVPDLVVHVQQDLTSNDIQRPLFDENNHNVEITPFLEHAFDNYVEDLAASEHHHTEILQLSNFLQDNITLQEELNHLQPEDDKLEIAEEMNLPETRWESPITNEIAQHDDPNQILLNIIEMTNYAKINSEDHLEETTADLINSNVVDKCSVQITVVENSIQSLANSFDVPILHAQPAVKPQKENVTKKKQKPKQRHQQPLNGDNNPVSLTKLIEEPNETSESKVVIPISSEIPTNTPSNSAVTEINTNTPNGTIPKDINNGKLQKSSVITNSDQKNNSEVAQELQSATPQLNFSQKSLKINNVKQKSRIPIRRVSSVTSPAIIPVQRSGEINESDIKVESINRELDGEFANESPTTSDSTTEIYNVNKELNTKDGGIVASNNETMIFDSATKIQLTILEDSQANRLEPEQNFNNIPEAIQIQTDLSANIESSETDLGNGPAITSSEPEDKPDTFTENTQQNEEVQETEHLEHLSPSNSTSNMDNFVNDEIMQSDFENGSVITASDTDIHTSDSERDSYTDDDSVTEHNSISDAPVSANSAIAIGVNKSQQNLSELVSDTQRLIKLMKDEINSDIASFVSDEDEYSDDYESDSDQWTDDEEGEEIEEEEELELEEDGEEEYEDEEAEAEGDNAVEDPENSWTETDGEYDSEYYEGIEDIDTVNQANVDQLPEKVTNDVNANESVLNGLDSNDETQESIITETTIMSEETHVDAITRANDTTDIEQLPSAEHTSSNRIAEDVVSFENLHNANGNVEDFAVHTVIEQDSLDEQEPTNPNGTEILGIHESTELVNFEIPQYAQTIEANLQNNIASIQKSLHVSTHISVERRSSRDLNGDNLQISTVNEIVAETATIPLALNTTPSSMPAFDSTNKTMEKTENNNSAIISEIAGPSLNANSSSASANDTKVVKKPLQKIPVRKASLPGPFKSLQNSNVKAMQQELMKRSITKPEKKLSKLSPPKIIPKPASVSRTLSERITKFIKPFASGGASSNAAAGGSGSASTSSAGVSSANSKNSKVPAHKHEIPKKKYHETCFSDDYQSSDEDDAVVEKTISRQAPKRQQSMPNIMQTDLDFVESQDVSFFCNTLLIIAQIQNLCSTWPVDCSMKEKLSTLWKPNLQLNSWY